MIEILPKHQHKNMLVGGIATLDVDAVTHSHY
jgi:hypothetical protein